MSSRKSIPGHLHSGALKAACRTSKIKKNYLRRRSAVLKIFTHPSQLPPATIKSVFTSDLDAKYISKLSQNRQQLLTNTPTYHNSPSSIVPDKANNPTTTIYQNIPSKQDKKTNGSSNTYTMSSSLNNGAANVLSEKDVNTDMSGMNMDAGVVGDEKDLKSMEYHRQVLASKMAASKYVCPYFLQSFICPVRVLIFESLGERVTTTSRLQTQS